MPDLNLKQVIQWDATAGTNLTISTLKMQNSISSWSSSTVFTSLTGIEYAVNLSYIKLSNTGTTDISRLTDLDNLKTLNLSDNQISDISPLSSLASLNQLHISNNNISDISPLANMPGLGVLYASNNNISDISPLSGLTNLVTIELNGNNISNISPLSSLTGLTRLGLYNNEITSISPLANLVNISFLNVAKNQITDPSPLQSITNLQYVFYADNPLTTQPDFLADMPNYKLRTEPTWVYSGNPAYGLFMQSTDSLDKLVSGGRLTGESCTRFNNDPDWTCALLNDWSEFNDGDANGAHSFIAADLDTDPLTFLPLDNPNREGGHYITLTETTTPEGYYPDTTPKVAYAGCGGWFTIPGDDGSDPVSAYEALTSCDQVTMLPDNTLNWLKQAIPAATVEPIASPTTPTPRLAIRNTAPSSVRYRLLIKNSTGTIVNPDQPEIELAAGETLDINLSTFNLPAGSYTYQLMSLDNTNQPIEVTAGSFTVQAQATNPTPTPDPAVATPVQAPASQTTQAPATGFGAVTNQALVVVAGLMVMTGFGLLVRYD